jgi:hypothetical protein
VEIMKENVDEKKMLFARLVIMLGIEGMVALGVCADPATGRTVIDLPRAETTMEMLEMLGERTRGNLDDEEERLLRDTLEDLRLLYMKERRSRGNNASPAADRPVQPPYDDIPGNLA